MTLPSYVQDVAQEFAAREQRARDEEAAKARDEERRRKLLKAAVVAMATGRRAPKGADDAATLQTLLLSLELTPAWLEGEVARVRSLIAESLAADPPSALVAEALAQARYTAALERREEAAREAKRAAEEAGAALSQAEAAARLARVKAGAAMDEIPDGAAGPYYDAMRALEAARDRLAERVRPTRGTRRERVPIEDLEANLQRAAATASAAWRSLVGRLGEQ